MDQQIFDIAIVGGGFSGTLVAAHLLGQSAGPLRLALFEAQPEQSGLGVAYSTVDRCHLLNVPAGNMSALPDWPDHFLDWAQRQTDLIDPPWVTAVDALAYLPRRAYGMYLRSLLDQAEQGAGPAIELARCIDEITAITHREGRVVLQTAAGSFVAARQVVLALGNFRPRDPAIDTPDFYQDSRYQGSPWSPQALADVAKTNACLLIGAGLTMADWALALSRSGYQGTIHVLSRRGLWPAAHRPYRPVAFDSRLRDEPSTVRRLLRLIRSGVDSEEGDWRAVIDGLRPHSQAIWSALPLVEKRRFLRHLRHYWDLHRHRVAPVVEGSLDQLLRSGRLLRHVGRLQSFAQSADGITVSYRPRGRTIPETIQVDAVVNCSGSESDYRKLDSPLVRSLLEQGLARPDPLHLGLDVAANGALLGTDGIPSQQLFTVGPPKKGMLWETTAVPEIRCQAAELAQTLLIS
ncbi:MAG: hypothetical protein FIA97_13205 [Methylococcaceae bacterium]|nr:hypothetical protein [Methylococcaceae bacterium]